MARAEKKRRNEEGSTLIGLLIGFFVLAILVTVAVVSLGTTAMKASVAGRTGGASVAACTQTVKTVEAALEAYRAQTPTGDYPATLAVLTTKTTGTPTSPRGPWLNQVPSARLAKNGYVITYSAPGRLTVKTKTTTLPGTTATACKAA